MRTTPLEGVYTAADSVNYTQGVQGIATWPCLKESGGVSGHVSVRNSNLHHQIRRSGKPCRGFIFENITGNVDLSNATAGGSLLINVHGKVTDPKKAATVELKGNGLLRIRTIHTDYVYDDQAEARAHGLRPGDVYRTPAGVLMVVY